MLKYVHFLAEKSLNYRFIDCTHTVRVTEIEGPKQHQRRCRRQWWWHREEEGKKIPAKWKIITCDIQLMCTYLVSSHTHSFSLSLSHTSSLYLTSPQRATILQFRLFESRYRQSPPSLAIRQSSHINYSIKLDFFAGGLSNCYQLPFPTMRRDIRLHFLMILISTWFRYDDEIPCTCNVYSFASSLRYHPFDIHTMSQSKAFWKDTKSTFQVYTDTLNMQSHKSNDRKYISNCFV